MSKMFITRKKYKELTDRLDGLEINLSNKHKYNNDARFKMINNMQILNQQIIMHRHEIDGVAVLMTENIIYNSENRRIGTNGYTKALYSNGTKVCEIPDTLKGDFFINNGTIYIIVQSEAIYTLTHVLPDTYGWVRDNNIKWWDVMVEGKKINIVKTF